MPPPDFQLEAAEAILSGPRMRAPSACQLLRQRCTQEPRFAQWPPPEVAIDGGTQVSFFLSTTAGGWILRTDGHDRAAAQLTLCRCEDGDLLAATSQAPLFEVSGTPLRRLSLCPCAPPGGGSPRSSVRIQLVGRHDEFVMMARSGTVHHDRVEWRNITRAVRPAVATQHRSEPPPAVAEAAVRKPPLSRPPRPDSGTRLRWAQAREGPLPDLSRKDAGKPPRMPKWPPLPGVVLPPSPPQQQRRVKKKRRKRVRRTEAPDDSAARRSLVTPSTTTRWLSSSDAAAEVTLLRAPPHPIPARHTPHIAGCKESSEPVAMTAHGAVQLAPLDGAGAALHPVRLPLLR
eukprot:TRINITY_DN5381_c0_g1_i1.p1 TRINITY_DN5381_c0_g1~~TRINITY_DN5381_c0_g1_i1.p1  ORF type:complete len:372 (+),score=81.23 TRINITY_DN5381_c0_g1_i1:83-1117(+)